MKHNPKSARVIAALREDRTRLAGEVEALSTSLDEMHEILARKNAAIRLLAMGDCTASELGLSDKERLAT